MLTPHGLAKSNVPCSLSEDVAAATILESKDIIWLVTWTLMEDPLGRVTKYLNLPSILTVLILAMKNFIPNPLNAELDSLSVLSINNVR